VDELLRFRDSLALGDDQLRGIQSVVRDFDTLVDSLLAPIVARTLRDGTRFEERDFVSMARAVAGRLGERSGEWLERALAYLTQEQRRQFSILRVRREE
jgi:hypothetical protein